MHRHYIIRHSSIASVQYVTLPEGNQARVVYVSEEKQPEYDIDNRRIDPEQLPLRVRAEVNRRFGMLFSVPVNARESLVRSFQPQEIAA